MYVKLDEARVCQTRSELFCWISDLELPAHCGIRNATQIGIRKLYTRLSQHSFLRHLNVTGMSTTELAVTLFLLLWIIFILML